MDVDGACEKSPGHLPWAVEDVVTATPVTPLSDDPRSVSLYRRTAHPPEIRDADGGTRPQYLHSFSPVRAAPTFSAAIAFSLPLALVLSENLYLIELKVPHPGLLCGNHFVVITVVSYYDRSIRLPTRDE